MKDSRQRRAGDSNGHSLISEGSSFYQYAESNPSPIVVTDTQGTIRYVNTAWVRLTGYSAEEVRGKNLNFLRSGKTPPEHYKQLWETLKGGGSFESEDFVDRRKDGSEFSVRSVFFPIQKDGTNLYFVQMMQDISKQKRLEKQKDAFIITASHELRSPLSAIMFSLELLKHELGTIPTGARKVFETLQNETRRFTSLLNYLLDVNRIQTGVLKLSVHEHNLRHLVLEIAGELQQANPDHLLVLEGSNEPVLVAYDSARIVQVITNLIVNAVKYSPQGSKVIIRLDTEPDKAVFSVQDFGIGIAVDEQERIFDILYRAKSSKEVSGTGLGLYISAQIIAAHGGRLWITSELDKGSTFYFSLPRA